MNETQDRIRDALEEVLTEYGLEWDRTRRSRHNAVEFIVNGTRLTHVYSSGGAPHRAHLNARSDLRNRLKMLGLQPKVIVEPTEPELLEPAMPDMDMMPEDDVFPADDIVAAAPDPIEPEPEPIEESIMQEQPEPIMEEATDDQPRAKPKPTKILEQPIPVIRGHIFQSPKVLAIKVERELIIEQGRMLIIPLNKPGAAFDMSEEQFHLLYDEVAEESAPVTTPTRSSNDRSRPEPPRTRQQSVTPPPLPTPKLIMPPAEWSEEDINQAIDEYDEEFTDQEEVEEVEPEAEPEYVDLGYSDDATNIIAYLQSRRGAVKTKVIADALGKTIKSVDNYLRRMMNDGVVENGPSGFWTISSNVPKVRPVSTSRSHRTSRKMDLTSQGVAPRRRSRNGPIQPQLGRIIAAMVHAARMIHPSKPLDQIELTAKMVVKHLDARDSKQYAARLLGAIDLGLAARGDPLPGDQRGRYYYVTEQALSLLKQAGTYAYDIDMIPVPQWYHKIIE